VKLEIIAAGSFLEQAPKDRRPPEQAAFAHIAVNLLLVKLGGRME